MKAAVWHGGQDIRIEEVPDPSMGPNDVLVKVRAVGICGSDLHAFEGISRRRIPPLIMGHEVAGEVAQVGKNVKNLKEKDRVVVYPILSCGDCEHCASGNENICEDIKLLGLHIPGGFAEYTAMPTNKCIKIPDPLTFEKACLTEPLSVAVHVVNNVPLKVTDNILIVGAGIIGSMTTQVARLRTSGQIVVTDVLDSRLKLAEKLGADITINSKEKNATEEIAKITHGRGVDVSIEAVGIQSTVQQAQASVKKGGIIAAVGLLERDVKIDLMKLVSSELKLYGSYAYNVYDFRSSINLIARDKINLQPYLTHIFPLKEVLEGFKEMATNKETVLKVILKP